MLHASGVDVDEARRVRRTLIYEASSVLEVRFSLADSSQGDYIGMRYGRECALTGDSASAWLSYANSRYEPIVEKTKDICSSIQSRSQVYVNQIIVRYFFE